MDSVTECSQKSHKCFGSPYEKASVPRKYFYLDENDLTSKHFKQCFWCREHKRENNTKARKKIYKKSQSERQKIYNEFQLERQNNAEFLICTRQRHPTYSTYPRNAVPAELFRKIPGNSKSSFLNQCLDCRTAAKIQRDARQKKIKDQLSADTFCCSTCIIILNISQRAIKVNGEPSSQCTRCQNRCITWKSETKGDYKKIIFDIKKKKLTENHASCELCKCIYLKSPDDNNGLPLLCLETDIIDGERCVLYEEEWYIACDFIDQNLNLIEYGVLEFDHLTEEEQRARGLLKPDESYIPKKAGVIDFRSYEMIHLEAGKCQLICRKCHIKETMKREKNTKKNGYNK
jgi:hypothetical protein